MLGNLTKIVQVKKRGQGQKKRGFKVKRKGFGEIPVGQVKKKGTGQKKRVWGSKKSISLQPPISFSVLINGA